MKQAFDEEYVRRVREETQRYTRDLLEENQKLRTIAAMAKQDLERLQQDVQRYASERAGLDRQLQTIEAEGQRYLQQYISVEQQNANLANLYVASFRLHAALERSDVIDAIKEIVINLIGSEEMAILEIDATRSHLELIASVGVDEARYGRVPAGRGIIGECVRTGEIFVAPAATADDSITACIPLKVGSTVIGVIAIFRLLGQKSGIEDVDRELFNLLATHAATALYCSALHAAHGASLLGVA